MPTLISFLSFVFLVVPPHGIYGVTNDPQAVTFYTLSMEVHGSTVLLAHEDMAGASFDDLVIGDVLTLAYPDYSREFEVTDIQTYKALNRNSIYGYFMDLNTGMTYESLELGNLLYESAPLILQTCIANEGIEDWGRLFVFAKPRRIEKVGVR